MWWPHSHPLVWCEKSLRAWTSERDRVAKRWPQEVAGTESPHTSRAGWDRRGIAASLTGGRRQQRRMSATAEGSHSTEREQTDSPSEIKHDFENKSNWGNKWDVHAGRRTPRKTFKTASTWEVIYPQHLQKCDLTDKTQKGGKLTAGQNTAY